MKISVEDFEEILDLKLSADSIKFINDKNFEYEFANSEEHNLWLGKFVNFLT